MALAGPQNAWRILQAKLQLTCGLDSQCFVKNVFTSPISFLGGGGSGESDTFKFSFCAPRYKPGFDRDNPEEGKAICAQASQKCTAVFVKKVSGWKCEANCHCIQGTDPSSAKPSQTFVEEMNAFCSSMGDCGSSVSYTGEQPGGAGYSVRKTKGDRSWLGDLTAGIIPSGFDIAVAKNILDAEPTQGEYIEANNTILNEANGNLQGFLGENGILDAFGKIDDAINQAVSGGSGNYGVPKVPTDYTSGLTNVGMVAGGAGTSILAFNYIGTEVVPAASGFAVGPSAMAFGGALAGAGIGAAAVGFLIDVLGIGPGLGQGLTYGLIGAGGLGGGLAGYGYFSSASGTLGEIGWLGVYIFVVVIVIIIILAIIGVGDIVELNIEFQCKTWEAPKGGSREHCGTCGEDKLSDGSETFPCNEYACEALGQDCMFVKDSEGTEGGICEYVPNDDVSAPIITDIVEESLSEGFSYERITENNFEITKDDGNQGCIDQFESLTFSFLLDEYAKECRVSGNPGALYQDMVPIGFSGRNITYTFNSQEVDALGIENFELEEVNDVNIYFACEDLKGNHPAALSQTISLCVVPEDHTSALVDVTNDEQVLPYDAESWEIAINTNEPAQCRWSDRDISYGAMSSANQLNCLDKSCSAVIPLRGDSTRVYVTCLDRPEWDGTDREDERNENEQRVLVELTRSESSLEISFIKPEGDVFKAGRSGATVELGVDTRGGVDGNANCFYSFNNGGELLMEATGQRSVHTQMLGVGSAALLAGFYEIDVGCEDVAKNIARKETNFTVEVDSTYPKITRIFIESGTLYVVTDENSVCGFVNRIEGNSCSFEIDGDETKLMRSEFPDEKFHSTSFEKDKTYFVKCKDLFDNGEQFKCEEIKGGIYANYDV